MRIERRERALRPAEEHCQSRFQIRAVKLHPAPVAGKRAEREQGIKVAVEEWPRFVEFLQASFQPSIVLGDDHVCILVDHQAGAVSASQHIGRVSLAAAGAQRDPGREPEGVQLLSRRIRGVAGVVAPPERHASRDHLDINPPPPARAVVDLESRMRGPQVVPECIEPLDVADLGDAHAIRRVDPEWRRIDVEILPVPIHAPFRDEVGDDVRDPLPRGRIAEIQHSPAILALEKPLRMSGQQRASRIGLLGLEPEEELHSVFVQQAAQRREPVGKGLLVRPPAPAVPAPRRVMNGRSLAVILVPVPTRVDPVHVEWDFFLRDLSDARQLLGDQCIAPCEICRRPDDRLSVFLRGIIGEQQPAPGVVRLLEVAAPVHQQDPRRADRLARVQQQMRVLHARAHHHAVSVLVPRKFRGPVPRPADCSDDPLFIDLEIEKRERYVGGPSSYRGQPGVPTSSQRLGQRLKIRLARDAPPGGMKHCLRGGGGRQRSEQRCDILDDRRVALALVRKFEHPLDRVEVLESPHLRCDRETGRRIGECLALQRPPVTWRRLSRPRPCGKEFG